MVHRAKLLTLRVGKPDRRHRGTPGAPADTAGDVSHGEHQTDLGKFNEEAVPAGHIRGTPCTPQHEDVPG
ncbi:hypothetical protein [Deinococcus peraridilitoris]|uniref:hypothetical protein n=1 Tax=Deinococcus peraridilitoris TaxID=432329 RepID=UPI00059E7441|nr:hypothetical protein [Deinococcus peraridilitoris]